jgi:hypothetical protein
MEKTIEIKVDEKSHADSGSDNKTIIQSVFLKIGLNETFDNQSKQFIYQASGTIDADQFRDLCWTRFCIRIFKIQHNGRFTRGFSKSVY